MLLENYPHARPRMMVLNMANRGVMDELTDETSFVRHTRDRLEKAGILGWPGQTV